MAANHPTLAPGCLLPILSWTRRFKVAEIAILLGMTLSGCSGDPEPQPLQFTGVWKSSRLNSRPLYLLANGDWEIRTEDSSRPLQYGVWQVQSRHMPWTFRANGKTVHDKNRIESFGLRQFVLREQDGSLTSFTRLD